MTAQEKLIDYDDDDIEFQMFTTDFSNINTSNIDPKKRKTLHDPSASQDENMMETPSKSHTNNFISNENDLRMKQKQSSKKIWSRLETCFCRP